MSSELAEPGFTWEFEIKRVGEAFLPRSSEEKALELMPRGGLMLRWGLDLLGTRTVLQEPHRPVPLSLGCVPPLLQTASEHQRSKSFI